MNIEICKKCKSDMSWFIKKIEIKQIVQCYSNDYPSKILNIIFFRDKDKHFCENSCRTYIEIKNMPKKLINNLMNSKEKYIIYDKEPEIKKIITKLPIPENCLYFVEQQMLNWDIK